MSKTVDLNIPRTAAERAAKTEGLSGDYLAQMRAHVDEGGQLSHRNGIDLLAEVERLRALTGTRSGERVVAWNCVYPTYGHFTLKEHEAEQARADGADVRPLVYASPQTDKELRAEIRRYQASARHWREECGKLHSCMATQSDRIEPALRAVLSSLIATTSLIIRAEDMKCAPSKAVASDTMFRMMLDDYDRATIKARAVLTEKTLEPDIEECGNHSAGSPP